MHRAALQYAALILLLTGAVLVRGTNTAGLIHILRRTEPIPGPPFAIAPATRTIDSRPFQGDQVLAIGGRPFNAARQFDEAIESSRPGETIRFTLSEPNGGAIERDVVIPNRADAYSTLSQYAVPLALNLLVPIVALGLGFAVAAIRPTDWNAWLVLFLMLGFTETVATRSYRPGPVPDAALAWNAFWSSMWPSCMLLFGIYFPTRSVRDRRWPWIKYILITAFTVVNFGYWAVIFVWQHDLNAAAAVRGTFSQLTVWKIIALIAANGAFFASFHRKSVAETSPDARRRLQILRVGSRIGLGPTILLAFFAVIQRSDLFALVPWGITVVALLLLVLFPLTLAYVIVVERAMDLRFVIRTGVKYSLAKAGLWILRALFVAIAVYLVRAGRGGSLPSEVLEFSLIGVGLLVLRQRRADRISLWIDRKFFREAYDAEKILADLATEVTRYLEVQPLLERVGVRVGETLHVDDVVILLREGDVFRTAYSTHGGEPMDIPASSRIVTNLGKRNEPLEIQFDKPPLWLRSLSAEELQTLDFMRTQLLLPLSGRDRMAGIMSLGPKRSEAPYSPTDIRLLQAVAWQTGMALENSRLLASLAEEAANRERISTELEIAREVQERLFPQKEPDVSGIECAGYCRPAQGVGGDYYDFLQLPDGQLGIAIGDVSGKGIAAALLMASLQASLRGQALAGVSHLAELMTHVNTLVYDASTPSRYATLFYAEYDPVTRHLCFVNAGHNPPFVLRGCEVIRLETGGPVVGLLANPIYDQAMCSLRPGDVLVAYTDGISDALNEQGEEWDEERFIAAARESAALDPPRMIQGIFQAADAFTGTAKQYDDMTLLVIKVNQA